MHPLRSGWQHYLIIQPGSEPFCMVSEFAGCNRFQKTQVLMQPGKCCADNPDATWPNVVLTILPADRSLNSRLDTANRLKCNIVSTNLSHSLHQPARMVSQACRRADDLP